MDSNVEVQNRVGKKHGYEWLMNASEQELLLNKNQATELVNSTVSSGDNANLTDYLWCNKSTSLTPAPRDISANEAENYASRELVEINFLEKFDNDHSAHSSMPEDQNVILEPIHSTYGMNSVVPASDNVYETFTRPFSLSWIQNNMPLYEQSFNGGSSSVRPTGDHTYGNNADNLHYNGATGMSMVRSQPRENAIPLGHAANNAEHTFLSLGGFNGYNNLEMGPASSRVVSNVRANQPFTGGVRKWKDFIIGTREATTSRAVARLEMTAEEKKNHLKRENNFPINVESLLLTGILDGVQVTYVQSSRMSSLRGVIRGQGYLCGCESCKLLKCISAYEFEHHAGFTSGHPNNHIYFPNGKSIYEVAAELKATPRDQLFDAIKNATGSPINQENFLKWKASYVAELAMVLGVKLAP